MAEMKQGSAGVSALGGLAVVAAVWATMWAGGLAFTLGSGRTSTGGVTTVTCHYFSATALLNRQYAFQSVAAETFNCPWVLKLASVRDTQ